MIKQIGGKKQHSAPDPRKTENIRRGAEYRGHDVQQSGRSYALKKGSDPKASQMQSLYGGKKPA
jgi:hypothetical protein